MNITKIKSIVLANRGIIALGKSLPKITLLMIYER